MEVDLGIENWGDEIRLEAMNQEAAQIESMRDADRERLARMVREQPPVTREAWDKQVKVFEAAGRGTKKQKSWLGRLDIWQSMLLHMIDGRR